MSYTTICRCQFTIRARRYATDINELNRVLKDTYKDSREKPLIVAPDGFFDRTYDVHCYVHSM